MTNLVQEFKKEPKNQQYFLISALVAFIATLLPWVQVSIGVFGSISTNGWNGYGHLTAIGSLAILALWILNKSKVKLGLPIADKDLNKILAIAILAGPIILLFQSGFEFSFMGLGFYLAILAGATTTYFAFQTKK